MSVNWAWSQRHSRKPNFVRRVSIAAAARRLIVVTTSYCCGASGHQSLGFSQPSTSLTTLLLARRNGDLLVRETLFGRAYSPLPPGEGAIWRRVGVRATGTHSLAMVTVAAAAEALCSVISRPSCRLLSEGIAKTSDV